MASDPKVRELNTLVLTVAVLGLIGFQVWEHLPLSKSAPADKPEAAVVELGQFYARDLLAAAAKALETSADGNWTSGNAAKQTTQDNFDTGLILAARPIGAEMARRFGESHNAPMEPAKAADLRRFERAVAVGIRRGPK